MECKKCNSPKIIKSGKQMNITLRQVLIYGDDAGLANPENENLKGQLYKHYDEAGLVEIPEYDFKGNVLTKHRQCISDAELMSVFNGPPTDWEVDCYRVDWTGFPNIIDTKIFETNSEYDALNRVIKVTYPEDTNGNRKIGIPTYNRAGALEKVQFDETDYVEHIAYNAKGQRLLIAFGNGVMTRYSYDNRTFRLKRLKSEKFTQTNWEFSPNTGTVKQDCAYINDLIGNIVEINDKSPNCGVGGTSSLDREFEYDPLYRLIKGDGRENNPSTPFPWWDDSYRSKDNSLTTAYTQHYTYDKLGNIQKLQHIGNNNFTRNFDYSNPNNKLNSISVGINTYSYSYDNAGNQIQENSNRFFEWDFANNMRCFYNQAGMAEPTIYAQYLYDSAGNRVKKIVRTQGGDYESITYIDGAFEYKIDGSDEQNLLHIMDDTSRIAMVRLGDNFGDTTPAVQYNLEDYLGSSVVLLETNSANVSKEEYYAFGETSFGSYAKKRYKYCGKERDEESGMYYYGARYYAAWMCRFVSVDPLARDYPYLTPYNYAGNKPITHKDIDGMKSDGDEPVQTSGIGGSLIENNSDITPNVNLNENDFSKYDEKNAKENLLGHSGPGPGIRTLNFGLFTLTIRIGKYSKWTKIRKIGIDFDWNYRLSMEEKTKTKWKTQRFVIRNMNYSGTQLSPNTQTYSSTTVGTSRNLRGRSLNNATAGLNPNEFVIRKVKLKTKRNDHGGDSFYQFNVGGQVVNHQNSNRVSKLNPSTITPSSNVSGSLLRQTPHSDGTYDACDGYKLIVRVQYKSEKTVKRLKFVRIIN